MEKCLSFIDALAISNNEKALLRSIVERQRTGEVSILADSQEVANFKIHITADVSREAFALGFLDALRRVVAAVPEGKEYEFTFIEN